MPPMGLRLARERVEPPCSPELCAVLGDFTDRARREREQRKPGEPMPAEQVKNWQELFPQLDGALARPGGESPPPHDLVRARMFLEDALELDYRVYGEVPQDIVDDALARISQFVSRLSEARRPKERPTKPVVQKAPLLWPVAPVSVTSLFGRRLHPFTKVYQLHQGIDLAAAKGQRVTVAGDGTVLHAGYVEGYGNLVDVDHGKGVMTRYGHLSSILVAPGDTLKQGDVLGLAGATGLVTGAHLHFEIWKHGQAVDPLEALGDPEDAAPVANR